MRPPMSSDHVVESKKRILYTKKHAPYNAGEERVVAESIARRLCVLGVAIPAPIRTDLTEPNSKGVIVPIEDKLGGWNLTGDEASQRHGLDRAKKEAAGDYKDQVENEEADRKAEEERVLAEADRKAEAQKDTVASDKKASDKKKAGGFLKGGREAKNEPKD